MAHKPISFKLDKKKNRIILYTNVEAPAEKTLIDFYLGQGYTPMYDEKKPSKSVDDMRTELEEDKETLAAFDEAYAKKQGFFEACKIYSKWKKEQNKKKKEEEKKEKNNKNTKEK